jgi:hypothetical protein
MPTPFFRVTAEAVVATVDAVYSSGRSVDQKYVAEFAQLTQGSADAALRIAAGMGLIEENSGKYIASSVLCRSFSVSDQKRKAAALRIVLEGYEPFVRFRERLISTDDATTSAIQTKIVANLDGHHDDIKETLLSLGQYSQAILAEGGGVYKVSEKPAENALDTLFAGCAEDAKAEHRIRLQIGERAATKISREEVICPLANALQRATTGDPKGAVVTAGNAVESFLEALGRRKGVVLAGKNGINAKADELCKAGTLPRKILNVSKYLGHIRNAADHGIDSDINASWEIRPATGVEYVFVACSFIASTIERELSGPFVI